MFGSKEGQLLECVVIASTAVLSAMAIVTLFLVSDYALCRQEAAVMGVDFQYEIKRGCMLEKGGDFVPVKDYFKRG